MIFKPRFDPAQTFELLAEGVTVIPAVPAMYSHLLSHAEVHGIRKLDAPRLRYISGGGAPLFKPFFSRRIGIDDNGRPVTVDFGARLRFSRCVGVTSTGSQGNSP